MVGDHSDEPTASLDNVKHFRSRLPLTIYKGRCQDGPQRHSKGGEGPGLARGPHHEGTPSLLAPGPDEAALHFLGYPGRRPSHPELPLVHEAERTRLAAAGKGTTVSATEYGYSVLAEYSGEIPPDSVERIVDEVLGRLERVARGPVVSADEHGLDLRFSLVYKEPRELDFVAGEAKVIAVRILVGVGLEGLRLEALHVETEAHQESELATPNLPELVGLSEIADILGVTKQRVGQLRERWDFPKPVAELRSGPVWARPMLDRFVDEWPRRSGHPQPWNPDEISEQLIEEVRPDLTDRELVILRGMAFNKPPSEIAGELEMSREAFRSAVRRILTKVRVHSSLIADGKIAERATEDEKTAV